MNKKVVLALILIGCLAVVLILTRDAVTVNLFGYKMVDQPASLVFLVFTVIGVLIGALLM